MNDDDTYMIQNKHHIEMFNDCVLDQGYKTKAIRSYWYNYFENHHSHIVDWFVKNGRLDQDQIIRIKNLD